MTLYRDVDVVVAATGHPHGGPAALIVPVLIIAAIVYVVVRRRRRVGAPNDSGSSPDARESGHCAADASLAVTRTSQVPDRPRIERPASVTPSTFTGPAAISLSGLTKSYGDA